MAVGGVERTFSFQRTLVIGSLGGKARAPITVDSAGGFISRRGLEVQSGGQKRQIGAAIETAIRRGKKVWTGCGLREWRGA